MTEYRVVNRTRVILHMEGVALRPGGYGVFRDLPADTYERLASLAAEGAVELHVTEDPLRLGPLIDKPDLEAALRRLRPVLDRRELEDALSEEWPE